jgi:hypothetical protein
MTDSDERRWFNDEGYKASLEQKINTGKFYISYSNGMFEVPARVIRIIYAGYRVVLPNEEEVTVNLWKEPSVREVSEEEYQSLTQNYFVELEKIKARKAQEALELQQHKDFQMACLHEKTTEIQVVKAAGCDIDDTTCEMCQKILRRSWSTAYDRDPNDLVSDWEWWLRECKKRHGDYVPKKEDYDIVAEINSIGY